MTSFEPVVGKVYVFVKLISTLFINIFIFVSLIFDSNPNISILFSVLST